jgi:transcriptional regulator with XRE-family HTH domain
MPKKAQKKAPEVKKSDFSQRLAQARRERGLTLMELADKAKVHISHIQRIEAGKSQPTVEILKRLALALQVSADLLIFNRSTEVAAARLADLELIEQFAAVQQFNDQDKQAIKTVLSAMILKQKLESLIPTSTSSSSISSSISDPSIAVRK